MRGVTCESVERELDFDVDRFLVLLFRIAAVQGDHTTIPQPPARDVPVAARVEGKTDEVEGRVGSRQRHASRALRSSRSQSIF